MLDEALISEVYAEVCGGDDGFKKDAVPLPPFKEHLKAIALCKRLCANYDVAYGILGSINSLNLTVLQQRNSASRQIILDEMLK